MSYETEEQQVEALKTWWAENGRAVIAGIVLGAVAIGGWSFWQQRADSQALVASDLFARTLAGVESGDAAAVRTAADTLANDHAGTLYASYGQLAAARAELQAGNYGAAAERLAWVRDESDQDAVRTIASVRLARIEGARDNAARGLDVLPSEYPPGFTGLVEEVRGDLLVMQGDIDAARDAYTRARRSANLPDPSGLDMKLNDLATVTDAS